MKTKPAPVGRGCREAVLQRIQTIPAFPATAGRLLALLQDPAVPIQDLVRLAAHDPGLTSNVLRMANSVHFAGARSIGSLHEAMIRLGAKRITAILLMALTAPMARQPIRGYHLEAGQLLEHAIATGLAAEAIAETLGVKAPPHLFTAGLLHDLGKIILGTFLEIDGGPIAAEASENHLSFDQAEYRVLGISHPEAGAILLQHWNLPLDVVEAVRFHHDPDGAAQPAPTADWVHLADLLAIESGIGAGIDGLQYRPCPGAVARTQFGHAAAETAICRMIERFDILKQAFQLAPGETCHGA